MPLHTVLLHKIKLSEYRIGIKFGKDLLAIKRNHYLSKIVNSYILYDLDA